MLRREAMGHSSAFQVKPLLVRRTARSKNNMNCWTVIGGFVGACLLIAFVGVVLERVYDEGYNEGYARGMSRRPSAGGDSTGKEVTK